MTQSIGPKAPEDGWLKRWPAQAAGLLLGYPLAIIVGLAAILLVSAIGAWLSPMGTGFFGIILVISVMGALGTLVPLAVTATLSLSEGYGVIPAGDRGAAIRQIVTATFLMASVTTTLGLLMLLYQIHVAGGALLPDAMPRPPEDLFLLRGANAVVRGAIAVMIFNPLWLGFALQLPMDFSQVRMSSTLFMQKAFMPWLTIILVTFLVAEVVMQLPAVLAPGLLIFYSAWLYVAAREVFGGISHNTIEQAATGALKEA